MEHATTQDLSPKRGLASSQVSKAESSLRGLYEEDGLGCAKSGKNLCRKVVSTRFVNTFQCDAGTTAVLERCKHSHTDPSWREPSPSSSWGRNQPWLPSLPSVTSLSPFFFSILLSGIRSDFFRPLSTFKGLWGKKKGKRSFKGCLQVKPPACCWASKKGDSSCQCILQTAQQQGALPHSTHACRHISELTQAGALRQQLPHAPASQNCRKAELKVRCLGIPQGYSPLWVGKKQGSSAQCSPDTSISPFGSGRKERRNPPMGAAVTDSSTEMFIPTPGCPQKGLGTSRGDLSPEEKSTECRKERC